MNPQEVRIILDALAALARDEVLAAEREGLEPSCEACVAVEVLLELGHPMGKQLERACFGGATA